MYLLRQLGSTTLNGAVTDESVATDYRQQLTDVNPRYIMALADSGRFTSDYTQILPNISPYTLPLPNNYNTTKMLHVTITSDQDVLVTTVSSVNGTSNVMIRAGANQLGCLNFCGQVTSIAINNESSSTAVIEYFMFELPPITTIAGWRDGSLATGLASP